MLKITTLYYLDYTGISELKLTKQQHDEFQGSGEFFNSHAEAEHAQESYADVDSTIFMYEFRENSSDNSEILDGEIPF